MAKQNLINDGSFNFSGEKFRAHYDITKIGRFYLKPASLTKSAWQVKSGQVTLCGYESADYEEDYVWQLAIAKSNAVRLCGEEGNLEGSISQTVTVKQPGKGTITFWVRSNFFNAVKNNVDSELRVILGEKLTQLKPCNAEWQQVNIDFEIVEIPKGEQFLSMPLIFSCGSHVIPPFAPTLRNIEVIYESHDAEGRYIR